MHQLRSRVPEQRLRMPVLQLTRTDTPRRIPEGLLRPSRRHILHRRGERERPVAQGPVPFVCRCAVSEQPGLSAGDNGRCHRFRDEAPRTLLSVGVHIRGPQIRPFPLRRDRRAWESLRIHDGRPPHAHPALEGPQGIERLHARWEDAISRILAGGFRTWGIGGAVGLHEGRDIHEPLVQADAHIRGSAVVLNRGRPPRLPLHREAQSATLQVRIRQEDSRVPWVLR